MKRSNGSPCVTIVVPSKFQTIQGAEREMRNETLFTGTKRGRHQENDAAD